MADIKKISKSDYALAQKWAIKYDITISQAVKRFEDIEELENATGKQKDAAQAEMYARLKWATLAPIAEPVEDVIEHDDVPDSETLADELPFESVEEDEDYWTTERAQNAFPVGRACFYEGDKFMVAEVSMAGTERRIAENGDDEGQWVKVWELSYNRFIRHPDITIPTGPTLSPIERAALDTHDAAYCYMGMAPIVECLCKDHQYETYKTSVDTFASALSIFASKCANGASLPDVSTEQSAVVQAAMGLVDLSKEREIATLKARVTVLEEREARMEKQATKHREFVRDMCGYSFNDRDDARYVSDCVDELENN